MRDLGYQGLLVLTFLGVAVAGLLYAKMIEPVLMTPAVQVQYWNFKNVNTVSEPSNIDIGGAESLHRLQLPMGNLE